MSGPNSHLRLDIYGVFRISTDATSAQIKKRYMKIANLFHPDKINYAGRVPTPAEQKTWTDIVEAWGIFGNRDEKQDWDNYDRILDAGRTAFQCLCEDCMNYPIYNERGIETGRGKFIADRNGAYRSIISMRWFCTPENARKWESANGYTPEVHGYVEVNGPPPPNTPPPAPTRNCPGCGRSLPFQDGGRGWKRYALTGPNSEFCCTEYCLEHYLWSQGIDTTKCNFRLCRKIRRQGEGDWIRDPQTRDIYCCGEHLAQEITIGSGSGLNTGGASDPLQAEKTTAITEIENALNDTPPVTNAELEDANQNWRNGIQNATVQGTIDLIKTNVLMDISTKRKAKNGGGGDPLLVARSSAITTINNELQKDPTVQTTELETSNQNWANDIQKATHQDQINTIQNRVLDDIGKKRDDKKAEKEVLALLAQGKTQNTYPELAQTIQELKKYLSTRAYQKHQVEINQLEEELSQLNPDQYKASVRNDLNEALKNNGLEAKKLEAETQKAIEEAIQDPTPSKKRVAEEAIAQNGANEGLKELLTSALGLKTKEEKQEMTAKILAYPNKNSYCEKSYQKLKSEVDKVLAQLQDNKLGNNNTQNFPPLLLKIILPLAAVGFLGLVIGIIWWKSKKRLKRQK